MKEKLKSIDFKKLLLDHCEKMVLGVLVLFVLFCLAGTSWIRYDKVPDDYLKEVAAQQQNLDSSTWPEDKKAELDGQKDIVVAVNEAQSKIDVNAFEYQTPEMFDLYPKRERRKQPSFLAVRDLIAISSEVILEFLTEEEQQANPIVVEVAANNTATVATTDPNAPVDPNAPPSSTAPPGGANSTIPGGLPGGVPGGATPSGIPGGVPGAGGLGAPGAAINAEGRRFVAVLGVYPMKEQSDIFAKALNFQIASKARGEIDFIDFELERQTAIAGVNPWTGKWEKVNLDIAYEILDKSADFDLDVVAPELTDAVFTMPLPRRLAGTWGPWATHPSIKRMTKEEAELQEQINQKILDEAREKQALEQPKAEKRGFSSKQNDLRQIRSKATNFGDIMKSTIEDMGNIPGMAGGISQPGGRPGMGRGLPGQNQATVALDGKVLLFRYFDFDVVPGNAYRYRVRLELRNPNYNLPIYEVEDPSFAEGQTRKSPWSDYSNAQVISQDTRLFLSKVEKSRSMQRKATANVEIFQYYQKAGTTINTELKKLEVGEFIAAFTSEEDGETTGGVETVVLRPAEKRMDTEPNVEFATRNVLLDLRPSESISPEFHTDLNLDKSKKRQGYGLVDDVIVVDEFGDLMTLNTGIGNISALSQAQARLNGQRAPWKAIVAKTQAIRPGGSGPSELDKLAAGFDGDPSVGEIPGGIPGGMPGGTMRPRGRSSRKRRR